MAEKFGCCSSHIECSKTLECVHLGEDLYSGCSLKKRLEKQKIKLEQELQQEQKLIHANKTQTKRPNEVYIAASKQFFKMLKRHKNNFSYNLTYEDANTVSTVFDDNGITYKNEISALDCELDVVDPVRKDDAPCNSRVVVEINGEEYNILNFNCYLIKEWHAEKINLAFRNKGFKSRVEVVGSHATPQEYKYRPPVKKEVLEVVQPKKEEVKPVIFKQVSLFEYMNASGY